MRETLACLIIDDPLLKPKYGCMDYEKLLEEMKEHNFFTEIAFIPCNYRRSDPKTVRLLAENGNHYAICVHGCNHLGNEFGGKNYQELSALASAALWRMEQHKRLTGLSYDPVFVFPQGRFSSVSMKALKDHGFFAAFNSSIRATDEDEAPVADSKLPAIRTYHNFPLFLRRYPNDKAGFAQDLESGRPIIIVEHHAAFRNGYETITDLVDWINKSRNIRWTSLVNIAEHYLGNRPTISWQVADLSQPTIQAKTMVRRFLSEARDNYVDTSNVLAKVYKMVRG